MAEQVSRLHLSVQFHPIPETLAEEFGKNFPRFINGLVKGHPGGLVIPVQFGPHVEDVYNFQPRSEDTWVVTFPKSGTTWVQEMVWLIINDCDFQKATEMLTVRSPFLEFPFLRRSSTLGNAFSEEMARGLGAGLQGLELVDQLPSPRVIKSHLPFHVLHPNLLDTCKVVYVARNPKDVIVSFFYHHRLIKFYGYSGDIDSFTDYFLKELIIYSPFFPHVLEAWNQRHHPNLLFLFYEDLKKDLRGQVKKVADFLQKPLTEEQLDRLTDHLSFDNFAKNEAVNLESSKAQGFFNLDGRFVRKGKTGDWKNHFSPELNERIDRWIESNLKGTDLKFVTELDDQD